jgi:predicted transcriptional regulator
MKSKTSQGEHKTDEEHFRGSPLAAMANLFRIMAPDERRRVLYALCQGPQDVAHLSRTMALSEQSIADHLKELASVGLVTQNMNAETVVYQLSPKTEIRREGKLMVTRISLEGQEHMTLQERID